MIGDMYRAAAAALANITVTGHHIPAAWVHYEQAANPPAYIVWAHTDSDTLAADDNLDAYQTHYIDVDIYTKNGAGVKLHAIRAAVNTALTNAGFVHVATRDSPDMHEKDTGYYHKTLAYAYQEETTDGTNRT